MPPTNASLFVPHQEDDLTRTRIVVIETTEQRLSLPLKPGTHSNCGFATIETHVDGIFVLVG